MIVYLNQYNSTIWHSKKYCEEDLDECFSESLGEVTEYDSSVLQNAYDLCEAAHDKDYVHAGQAMARLLQVYEDFRDEFLKLIIVGEMKNVMRKREKRNDNDM